MKAESPIVATSSDDKINELSSEMIQINRRSQVIVFIASLVVCASLALTGWRYDDVDIDSAISNGNIEELQQHLATSPDLTALIDEEATLLMMAASADSRNQAKMVETILNAGGKKSLTIVDENGMTALHHAAMARSFETSRVIELLLAAGADANQPTKGGMTPLMMLVSQNPSASSVMHLIRAGAKIDMRDKHGNTVLHWATGFLQEPRDFKTIATLVQEGADIDAKNNDGWTPVMAAALASGTDPLAVLFENIRDSDRKPIDRANDVLPNGWSPLLLAVASVQPDVWDQWLKQIAVPLNQGAARGAGMVGGMYSTWAKFGYLGRVWTLLAAGADPNATTADGVTVETLLEGRNDAESEAVRALIQVARERGSR